VVGDGDADEVVGPAEQPPQFGDLLTEAQDAFELFVAVAVADTPAIPVLLPVPAPTPGPALEPSRRSDVAAALRDSASVGLGLVPLGLAFGVVVTHAGLPWWCAVLFTSVVYAGSLEFLLVPLAVAAVPLATVALTAFLVNVRRVFYSLSFPLHRVNGRLAPSP
jgi:hypothetical protein